VLAENRLGPGGIFAGQGRCRGVRVVNRTEVVGAAVIDKLKRKLEVKQKEGQLGLEGNADARERISKADRVDDVTPIRGFTLPGRADEDDIGRSRFGFVDVLGEPTIGEHPPAVAEQVDFHEAGVALEYLSLLPDVSVAIRTRTLVRGAEDLDQCHKPVIPARVADLDEEMSYRLRIQSLDPEIATSISFDDPDFMTRVEPCIREFWQRFVQNLTHRYRKGVLEIRPDVRSLKIRVHAGEGRGHRPGLLGPLGDDPF
jgi:hypothetical protein